MATRLMRLGALSLRHTINHAATSKITSNHKISVGYTTHYMLTNSSRYLATGTTTTTGDKGQHDRIEKILSGSKKRVFIFMKGEPKEPACGYSNAVVQILNAYGVEYDSFDVLSDEEVRQGVKSFANWPTIPQVYVDGSFVGGCDILIQMHQNNELESLLKDKNKPDA